MGQAEDKVASPAGMFAAVPKVIKKKGRVAGFEFMRDRLLSQWELLSARANPYSLLKLAIEADRHAMFAEVAAAKAKDTFDIGLYDGLSKYLQGDVNVSPDAAGNVAEISGRSPLATDRAALTAHMDAVIYDEEKENAEE